MVFDIFIKDEATLVVGPKRGLEEELQDSMIDYQQDLKGVAHNLVLLYLVNQRRYIEIVVGSLLVVPYHHRLQLSHVIPQMGKSQILMPRASQVCLNPLSLYCSVHLEQFIVFKYGWGIPQSRFFLVIFLFLSTVLS